MARSNDTPTPKVEVTVSNRTVLRIIAAVILAVIFFAAVRHSAHTLTLIGVSLFLALALNAPVHWLALHLPGKRRGSHGLATGLSIGIVIVLLGGFLALIVPPLVHQTNTFVRQVPGFVNQVRDGNSGIGRFVREHHLQGQVDRISSQLSHRAGDLQEAGRHH